MPKPNYPNYYLSKGAINVFASCHDDCLQALLELSDAGQNRSTLQG